MLSILVVDDSLYQRTLICSALERYGDCHQAENGRQAVDMFREAMDAGRMYDLVVMDILMPEMDGHEALTRINGMQDDKGLEGGERCRTIMLSSLDDPTNMVKAQFEAGAESYVTKPFEEEVLVEALINLELIDNPLQEAEA